MICVGAPIIAAHLVNAGAFFFSPCCFSWYVNASSRVYAVAFQTGLGFLLFIPFAGNLVLVRKYPHLHADKCNLMPKLPRVVRSCYAFLVSSGKFLGVLRTDRVGALLFWPISTVIRHSIYSNLADLFGIHQQGVQPHLSLVRSEGSRSDCMQGKQKY